MRKCTVLPVALVIRVGQVVPIHLRWRLSVTNSEKKSAKYRKSPSGFRHWKTPSSSSGVAALVVRDRTCMGPCVGRCVFSWTELLYNCYLESFDLVMRLSLFALWAGGSTLENPFENSQSV